MSNTSTSDTRQTLTDPRHILGRAVATALAVVDGVTPDQLHLPTPCDAFDVDQLLGHLAFALDRVAVCGRGDELGHEDAPVTSDDWPATIRTHATAVADAWTDDARLDAEIVLPWATMTGAQALGVYTNEVTVHTWDLAVATGQAVVWDDEVLAASRAAIDRELPIADRDAMWQAFLEGMPAGMDFSAPFANAQPVDDAATAIERLVAWNGRRPAAG